MAMNGPISAHEKLADILEWAHLLLMRKAVNCHEWAHFCP
jgi:hypothetical protein